MKSKASTTNSLMDTRWQLDPPTLLWPNAPDDPEQAGLPYCIATCDGKIALPVGKNLKVNILRDTLAVRCDDIDGTE